MKTILGIDIGSSQMKVVEAMLQGNAIHIVNAAVVGTPENVLLSESDVDHDKLTVMIKTLLRDAKIKSRQANISLLESQVFTRAITMPKLSEKELVQALRWEAERYVPLPLADVNMDFAILAQDQNTNKMDLMLVAAPLRFIKRYVDILEHAGITIESMENEALAILRLYKIAGRNSVVLDIGHSTTKIVLLQGEIIRLVRSISVGSGAITKAIVTELNLPHAQAEEYKKTYGIVSGKEYEQVTNVVRPIADSIIQELRQSITYFKEKYPQEILSQVILIGGGAYLPGLREYITDRIQVQTDIGVPWQRFQVSPAVAGVVKEQSSLFFVATGLALRDI
ncbi:MAG TPA: type IV pilus assembly protein PilM [Patescibacteria group bacterium]|nr:type IV pilus assembly protein PilM [Patescibacteria group bacterium]